MLDDYYEQLNQMATFDRCKWHRSNLVLTPSWMTNYEQLNQMASIEFGLDTRALTHSVVIHVGCSTISLLRGVVYVHIEVLKHHNQERPRHL